MRTVEKLIKNNNNRNNNNNNNNNHQHGYRNVSQIMLYFIDKQPYEQVEPVWKSYCESYLFVCHLFILYLYVFLSFREGQAFQSRIQAHEIGSNFGRGSVKKKNQ